MTKDGLGTLIKTNASDANGGAIIAAGTLIGKACVSSGTVTVNSGGTWDLGGIQRQIGILTGTGGQVINNGIGKILIVGNGGGSGSYAGVIADGTGAITFRKQGAGTTTLTGTNTFTGGITIDASSGPLSIGGAGQLGGGSYAGTITFSGAGTLSYDSSASQTLSGLISGAGALVQNGPGTLTLSGANSYSGTTTVGGGILAVSSAQTGAGAISVSDGATLKVNVSGTSQLSPSAFTLGSSTGGTLEFNGLTSKTTAPINVSGALTVNGSCSIKIDSLPAGLAVGDSYPLIAYGSGGVATLNIGSLPSNVTSAHLVFGSSPIRLVVDELGGMPLISLAATAPLATEGGNAGAITLTRSGRTNEAVTVGYSISGTASNGVDYTQLSGVVNLAAGQTQSVIYVNAQADAATEPVETVNLTLNPSGDYEIVGLGTASVLIADATNRFFSILAFDDEFNGSALDSSVWALHSGRTNVAVTNGSLELIAHQVGTDWVEGSIESVKHAAKYGYYECRMKVNDVDGMNNSFWLNTPSDLVSGNNLDRLEIDITEAHHYQGKAGSGIWDNAPSPSWGAHAPLYITDISAIYRTVALEWKNDNTLTYSWDGAPFYTNDAPTLLSADTMIPVGVLCSTLVASFAGPPGPGLDGSKMLVDYVRVWQKPGWTGAVNGNWGSATNWGPDGVPSSGYAAIFNGPSANTSVSLAADKFCHSLCFDNAVCPAFTFPAGVFSLHLGAAVDGVGGITICTAVTNSQTINLNLVADRGLQFGNFSRTPGTTLFLNGSIDGMASGQELQFCGYAPIQVSGGLSANIGRIIKWGPNTVRLTGTNAQTGPVEVWDGALVAGSASALGSADSGTSVSNGASLVFVGGTQYLNPEPLSLRGVGDVGRSGALDVEGAGKAVFSGPVTLVANTTLAGGLSGSELELAGPISGAFSVTKAGGGVLTLSGNSSYSGATTVTAGELSLNGTSLSAVTVSGGTLSGSGIISNNVTVTGGIHAPGSPVGGQTIYGDYTLGLGSTLRIDISGTMPAPQSDRVRVLGGTANTVSLAGALDISAPPGLPMGVVITVIENDGTDAISGTFVGLPPNYAFSAAGYWWRISYAGGDGNDVVLTLFAPPAPQLALALSGSQPQLRLVGEIGHTFEVEASTNLTQWSLVTNLFNSTGTLLFADPSSSSYDLRFYRAVLVP